MCEAVRRARSGLIDADLGGGVIKQRIARRGELVFFVYGFAKSGRDELETFRLLADAYLALDEMGLAAAQAAGAIVEATCDDEAMQE